MSLYGRLAFLLAAVGLTAMCGGKAVIDPGADGSGGDGSGASGPGPTTDVGPTTTTGPSPGICVDNTFGETRAMSGDCAAACEIFFCCAAQQCTGIDPDDEALFFEGCQNQCVSMMALIAVVDGSDCTNTIATVSSVSSDFADQCQNGF